MSTALFNELHGSGTGVTSVDGLLAVMKRGAPDGPWAFAAFKPSAVADAESCGRFFVTDATPQAAITFDTPDVAAARRWLITMEFLGLSVCVGLPRPKEALQ